MITKLTSVKTAIAKVIADLGLQEDDILISDMVEYGYLTQSDADELIGDLDTYYKNLSQ